MNKQIHNRLLKLRNKITSLMESWGSVSSPLFIHKLVSAGPETKEQLRALMKNRLLKPGQDIYMYTFNDPDGDDEDEYIYSFITTNLPTGPSQETVWPIMFNAVSGAGENFITPGSIETISGNYDEPFIVLDNLFGGIQSKCKFELVHHINCDVTSTNISTPGMSLGFKWIYTNLVLELEEGNPLNCSKIFFKRSKFSTVFSILTGISNMRKKIMIYDMITE